jgi:CheY-like chemotaxis protein
LNAADFTLLVVDDNAENREMLSRRLLKKGFQVLVAEGGREALSAIESQPVDLVLLDIMMPGMSGVEVLEELRKTRSAADLPVIMATAKTDSEDVVQALELGANDYVTKPIDFPVVLARVQSQLRLKKSKRAQQAALQAEAVERMLAGPEARPGGLLAERYRLESRMAPVPSAPSIGRSTWSWTARSRSRCCRPESKATPKPSRASGARASRPAACGIRTRSRCSTSG